MRNCKILFGVFTLTMMFSVAAAQNNPKADKIIKQSQEKFDALADVEATFTYTLNNPNLKKPVVKKGTVTLKKGKYKIVFPDEEMYCNGKFSWVLLKEEQEITKTNFDPKEGLSPDRLYKMYEKDTKSDYNGEEGNSHKVTLFAKHDDGDIWKTILWINKDSKLIDKAVMHGRNGSQYTYEMNNIKTNSGVADAAFTLNESKYAGEGWIVTDLSSGK